MDMFLKKNDMLPHKFKIIRLFQQPFQSVNRPNVDKENAWIHPSILIWNEYRAAHQIGVMHSHGQ